MRQQVGELRSKNGHVDGGVHCDGPGAKAGDLSRQCIKHLHCYGIVETGEDSEELQIGAGWRGESG